jgi:hypothetical protein
VATEASINADALDAAFNSFCRAYRDDEPEAAAAA